MTQYSISIDEFLKLGLEGYTLIPVYKEVLADLETPVSAYLKITQGSNRQNSFLLESAEGGERLARYSFMGTNPYKILKTDMDSQNVDPLCEIETELSRHKIAEIEGLPPFVGGAVGFLSYETIRHFEPTVDTFSSGAYSIPESVFFFTDSLLIFDHVTHKIKVIAIARIQDNPSKAYESAIDRIEELIERLNSPLPSDENHIFPGQMSNPDAMDFHLQSNKTKAEYHEMVDRAKEYIVAGDIIQVVPSQRLAIKVKSAPFNFYRSLRAINPSPYMYFLQIEDYSIVGASPEMLVRSENGMVETHPIAGTRRRGKDNEEDNALEQELLQDGKEIAEHVMLLDLGRNDIGRVSKPGTVQVTQMLEVEKYSHVMHLVSHVTGQLKEEMSCFDALRACFPAGTVSGAPKIRAMQIISELEGENRGLYAGAVGYFSYSGNMDTAIAIRTMVINNGIAYVQAGGGVVFDSDPEFERQESFHKMNALLRVIALAEQESL